MASQNNAGLQHQKDDAVTVVATVPLAANRLIGYDGAYATSAGGVHDAQGVSEFAAAAGQAVSVVTEYSYLVECAEPIAFGDYVKPAADGSGRAAVGTLTDHCGRALGATAAAGQLFEMQIVRHVHA
ncbi:capsid cement protein [Tibeticola sp.]|uniref:capsid cement protein n=1 Tax=Tibeticola sp. TaxID=2005368 RepID=UPI0025F427E0|nr:capsid cement protein [Tibeticola sp.]